MIPRNGGMLAHDQNVDGRGTWVYDGSKSEINLALKLQRVCAISSGKGGLLPLLT
jgi:hypothetical protein